MKETKEEWWNSIDKFEETSRLIESDYHKRLDAKKNNKVFYNFNEWQGFRFYLKAIRYRDYRSLIQHIKNKFTKDQ